MPVTTMITSACIARGNHLAAQNDEPEGNVHPVFASLMRAAFGPEAQQQIRHAQRMAYEKALLSHDWDFEMSDDHDHCWVPGNESLAQLKLARRELDPDGAIWNQYAPNGHKVQPL